MLKQHLIISQNVSTLMNIVPTTKHLLYYSNVLKLQTKCYHRIQSNIEIKINKTSSKSSMSQCNQVLGHNSQIACVQEKKCPL